MADSRDIGSLLETGYFKTSRSKSPQPPKNPVVPPVSRVSTRTDPLIPRSVNAPLAEPNSQQKRPPPPTVEDEEVALAKEHGISVLSSSVDGEPQSRGDLDQHPIIMEVHEHNPERRFVLVPNGDPQADNETPIEAPRQPNAPRVPNIASSGEYEANTGRKYDPEPSTAADGIKRSVSSRRKSRQDLPPIETDLLPDNPRQSYHKRTKSATLVDQPDYFSPQHTKRPSGDGLLSPQVIKHATGGREKVYYDYSRDQNGASPPQRSRSTLTDDRRYDDNYARPAQSSSPILNKRANSSFENTKQSNRMSGESFGDPNRYRDQYASPRLDRNNTEPPYYRPDRERDGLSRRTSSYRKRDSPPRREESGSSGEYSQNSRSSIRARRKSIVQQEDRESLLSPAKGPNTGRARSRAPQSPIPSPSLSSRPFADEVVPNHRSSTIVSGPREPRERPSPYPEDDINPRSSRLSVRGPDRSDTRSRSRATSINMAPALVMPAAIPIAIPAGPRSPVERKRSPLPSPPETRSSYAQSGPKHDSFWQPGPFDPAKDGLGVDLPVGSFRRYSEDADRAGLPNLPECSRKVGVVGAVDWLSLPRCDNFNICPDCYNTVFANSQFRNDFIPVLFRPRDKPIVCDFGSSPWYRIAWLLTIKTGQPDLRLFHQIAAVSGKVAANNQPCPGDRKAHRVWYSIKNPRTQDIVPEFTICFECARTIEVLLPSLTGVFVTLDPASRPSRSTCAMHFNSDRKRFVLYFDAMETTSDRAVASTQPPNISDLVAKVEELSRFAECREDRPVSDENWHVMKSLPEFTVCGECFDETVRPRLRDSNAVARNFYKEPQRLPVATCQLYSPRMKEIFKKACRRNDPQYLETKVLERRQVEADIHAKLARLDQAGASDKWTEDEVEKLIQEWKKWE